MTVDKIRENDKELFRKMVMSAHGEDPFPEPEEALTVADIARRAAGQFSSGDPDVDDLNAIMSDGFNDMIAFGYEQE